MGWQLAGQTLENGADRIFAEGIDELLYGRLSNVL